MDLHTDYYEDLGIPLVYQSFNVIDDSFPIFNDTTRISSEKMFNENNSIVPNYQTSSATTLTTGENQLAAEEEPLRWIVDELPPFPDLEYLIWEFVTQTEGTIVTSYYDIDPPDEVMTTDEVPIKSRSTQLQSVGDTINEESTPTEPPPIVEFLIETPQLEGRRLEMSHKYNTRRANYKKKILDFVVQEKELLDRLKTNQQRPKAHEASTPHDQWLHSKDWVNINLLRFNIPIKKVPNYATKKRYRTRKARSKKVPATSTTSSSAVCTTSTMGCVKDTSNQQ